MQSDRALIPKTTIPVAEGGTRFETAGFGINQIHPRELVLLLPSPTIREGRSFSSRENKMLFERLKLFGSETLDAREVLEFFEALGFPAGDDALGHRRTDAWQGLQFLNRGGIRVDSAGWSVGLQQRG